MINYVIENSLPLFQGTLLGSILGFLVSQLIQHFLSKSRDKENFNRQTSYDEIQKNKVTLNILGSFLNGLLRCWEEASFNALHAQTSTEEQFTRFYRKVSFDEFGEYKKELEANGIFPPIVWHSFDKLPEQIEQANSIKTEKLFHMAPARLAHFSDFCESLWGIAAEKYQSIGGNLKDLTRPMPATYEKY